MREFQRSYQVRTAFISDLHLGTRDCRAGLLLDFLHSVQMETLVLVGDIVDIWSLRRQLHWPQTHNDVLRSILAKAHAGTRVIYVPGNHDELMRDFHGHCFGQLELQREYVHDTARGMRLLVTHGDGFDSAVQYPRWLAAVGSGMYDLTLALNRHVNALRQLFGYPYWSLAAHLKARVGNALEYVQRFESAAAHAAHRRGFDGIVCGHIHRPDMRSLHGVLYCNDGDWVENCTALVEDHSGELELWNWAAFRAEQAPAARSLPQAA